MRSPREIVTGLLNRRSPEHDRTVQGDVFPSADVLPPTDTTTFGQISTEVQAALKRLETSEETGLTVVPDALLHQSTFSKSDVVQLVSLVFRLAIERDTAYDDNQTTEHTNEGLQELRNSLQSSYSTIDCSLTFLVQLLKHLGIDCEATYYEDGSHHVRLRMNGLEISKFTKFSTREGQVVYDGGELQIVTPYGAPIQLADQVLSLRNSKGELDGEALLRIDAARTNITPEVFKHNLLHATPAVFESIYGPQHLEHYRLVQHLLSEADITNNNQEEAEALAGVIGLDSTVFQVISKHD
jgi:hypothetical protein